MTDPTLPVPNIPLLRKAVEWAEAEAVKTDGTCLWDQGAYATPTDCGTSFCIAGYAVSVAAPEAKITAFGDLTINGEFVSWRATATRVLGITDDEGLDLFLSTNTITDVRRIAEQIAARAGDPMTAPSGRHAAPDDTVDPRTDPTRMREKWREDHADRHLPDRIRSHSYAQVSEVAR